MVLDLRVVLRMILNNKKSKKGNSSLEMLGILIIIVAFLLVIIPLISKTIDSSKGMVSGREACKSSVQTHYLTTVKEGPLSVSFSDINCKRRTVVVFDDHIEVNGKKSSFWDPIEKKYVNSFNLDGEVLNSIFAYELSGCWYQYWGGTLNFLREEQKSVTFSDKNLCGICSEIYFDESVRTRAKNDNAFAEQLTNGKPLFFYAPKQGSLSVWNSFLTTNNVSKDFASKDISYYDYLFNDEAVCDRSLDNGKNACNLNYLYFDLMKQNYGRYHHVKNVLSKLVALEEVLNPINELLNLIGVSYRPGTKASIKDALNDLSNYFSKEAFIDVNQDYIVFMAVATSSNLGSTKTPTYFAWVSPRKDFDGFACEEFFS